MSGDWIIPQYPIDSQPPNYANSISHRAGRILARILPRLAGVSLGLALGLLLTAYPPSSSVLLAGALLLALAWSEVGGAG